MCNVRYFDKKKKWHGLEKEREESAIKESVWPQGPKKPKRKKTSQPTAHYVK